MGAGNSRSDTTNIVNNNMVNRTIIDSLNQSMFNSAVNTLIKNSDSCSSSVFQQNQCVGSGTYDTGGAAFNYGGTQSNTGQNTLKCLQVSKTQSDMAQSIMQNLDSTLKSATNTDILNVLESASDASLTSGSATFGINSASGSTNNQTNTNITNDFITSVSNIFESNLSNNFTQDTMRQCAASSTQINTKIFDFDVNTGGGEINLGCDAANTINQLAECEQLQDAINKTTTDTLQELGLSVSVESTTELTTESKASSSATTEVTGIVQDLGNAIADIIGALNSPLMIVSIVILLVVVVSGYMAYKKFAGSKGGDGGDDDQGGGGFDGLNGYKGYDIFGPHKFVFESNDILSST